MNADHTPGPWSLDLQRSAIVTSSGDAVAVVCFHAADSLAQEYRNGRLLAAAPELLAALRELLTEAARNGLEDCPAVLLAHEALMAAGAAHHGPP